MRCKKFVGWLETGAMRYAIVMLIGIVCSLFGFVLGVWTWDPKLNIYEQWYFLLCLWMAGFNFNCFVGFCCALLLFMWDRSPKAFSESQKRYLSKYSGIVLIVDIATVFLLYKRGSDLVFIGILIGFLPLLAFVGILHAGKRQS